MKDYCKQSNWYSNFKEETFPTNFVELSENEITALANGDIDTEFAVSAIKKIKPFMKLIGNRFVFADGIVATDTERFEKKRGAVHSAKSAWEILTESDRVKAAAKNKEFDKLCVRPFRRITKPREFRLFVHDGELKAMSQYWLIRHFRRLEGIKEHYWNAAVEFVNKISDKLPEKNIVIDIYFTSRKEILIIDFNEWENCDPRLLLDWKTQDWSKTTGIKLIPPPLQISGDVNVSF